MVPGTERSRHRARIAKTNPEAYVDTSAFIAFLDSSDSHHVAFKRLFATTPALVTSALVIAEGHGWFLRRYDRRRGTNQPWPSAITSAEGHGWFLRRYDRRRGTQFLAFVDALPALSIHAFDASELSKVRLVLSRFADQNLTVADAHGLVIMKDRRNTICWSTDRHMGLTGVALAIA